MQLVAEVLTIKIINMKMNIKNAEHRGNVQEVINNYLEEMKMVDNAPRSFYSRDGGVNTIAIK